MIATSYQLIAINGSAVVTSLAPPSEGLTVEHQLQTNSNTPVAAPRRHSAAIRKSFLVLVTIEKITVNVDWVRLIRCLSTCRQFAAYLSMARTAVSLLI